MGGYKVGAGRPGRLIDYDGRKLTLKEIMAETGLKYAAAYAKFVRRSGLGPLPVNEEKTGVPADIQAEADLANLTPLEYMLSVIRDKNASQERRDRMAQAAAPYLHPKADTSKGKKDAAKDRATEAGKGKFAAGQAPKLVKFGRK